MDATQFPVYIKFPSEINDRLSYGDNHPARQAFFSKLGKAKRKGFEIKPLDDLIKLVEVEVEPKKEYPDQFINYLGLEGIESNTGKAEYKHYLGNEIHSTSKKLYKGNVVFAGLRPYLNKVHLIDVEEAIGSAELFVTSPDKEQIVPEFLVQYLLSDLTLNQTKWVLLKGA